MPSNRFNYPEPLVRALTVDRHVPVEGRIAVTQLIDSPLRRCLLKEHFNEIEEDCSENLWALLGKAVHFIIEQGNEDTETKITLSAYGATLSGVIDYHKDGQIIDWKVTKAWAVKYHKDGGWEKQLQVYAYMLRKTGHLVKKLSDYMILRDHNKIERLKNAEYPETPFVELTYDLWADEVIEAYVKERVALHLAAEKFEVLPEDMWCSPVERWAKPDKYAVMKAGAPKATRVYDTREEAEEWFKDKEADKITSTAEYSIFRRPGEDTKCLNYCSVSKFCPYMAKKQEVV